MRDYQRTITAGSSITVQLTALVMTCKTFYLPVVVQFDGGSEQEAKSGSVFDRTAFGGFRVVTLINRNTVDVPVFFYLGETAVGYVPDDNAITLATNRCFGNLGVADGAAPLAGLPGCDANGHLIITDNMNLVVSGVLNGKRRSSIIIRVSSDSVHTLRIKGTLGQTFLHMLAADLIKLDVDDDLTFSGMGGDALCTIGQIFNG